MLHAMTNFFVRLVRKYLPQPFTLAVILSVIVYIMGMLIMKKSAHEMNQYWGKGFFSLYGFTMQMVLVLVTGHALASAPVIQRLLKALASIPKSPRRAVLFMAFVGCLTSYLNWAFGLIAGALVARELAKNNLGKGLHYPLLVAAAYGGNVIRGPSSSIPLVIATPGHFLEKLMGVVPVTETLYSSWNLIITIVLVITIPTIFYLMYPKKNELVVEIDPKLLAEEHIERKKETIDTPAQKMDNSIILTILVAFAGGWMLYDYFSKQPSFNLNLDILIMIFMVFGIIAHKTLAGYANAINNAVKTSGGIILQFPFYAGMMGMMGSSGLAKWLSDLFVSFSTANTLPLFTFWSAGILNIFIPSGGGQWAVQGPIMMQAAHEIGASSAKVAMALAWGDSWTNQIQPFWALPLLAIANLGIRDIMGYCLMNAILVGIIVSIGLIIL
ncbi:short-chain fatty acid transporter [Acetomicrobium sp. S15 = DSM 107314]|jgi:short-chain fatty acids transporter|uniref:short-chain fatty acid transporter n=1 Tax=Acetomicrobium sp. S15 = DSM 107314 TaxID=2529858 RepID=UPI0018E165CD|nr:TIGR00366 family protein [Acetomicrobium sp. S15 = DSM 107314]